MSHKYSIVEYHSKQEKSRCGYCKNSNSSYSHGMTAETLTVQHYQKLIDRGWRRSGCYCYKPMMKKTCCPSYTISCEALNFQLSKSQKKIFKRMIKYIKNEQTNDDNKYSSKPANDDMDVRSLDFLEPPKVSKILKDESSEMQIDSVPEEINEIINSKVCNSLSVEQNKKSPKNDPCQSSEGTSKNSMGYDPSKGLQKKAKLMRIERKRQKLEAQGKSQEEIHNLMNKNKQKNTCKTLEDLFDELKDGVNKLEIKLVRTNPISETYKETARASYELYKKYQKIVHGDREEKLTERQYTNFLVKSPLKKYTPKDGPPHGYGSFHEQYWLNGTLIAVGVIDILPSCVSSVYFFYDPSYYHLSLGTFSSLREIYLTRQLNKSAPNLKYYYMGFYIHSCPKMLYKARMRPSRLLCPETYTWHNIEKCLPKLDASKYSRLNEDLTAIDEDGIVDVDQVLILYERKVMLYQVCKQTNYMFASLTEEIKEYATLVGKNCALSMLLYID